MFPRIFGISNPRCDMTHRAGRYSEPVQHIERGNAGVLLTNARVVEEHCGQPMPARKLA
jgi:hypothetical protein